jgi:hypothetical protein
MTKCRSEFIEAHILHTDEYMNHLHVKCNVLAIEEAPLAETQRCLSSAKLVAGIANFPVRLQVHPALEPAASWPCF